MHIGEASRKNKGVKIEKKPAFLGDDESLEVLGIKVVNKED